MTNFTNKLKKKWKLAYKSIIFRKDNTQCDKRSKGNWKTVKEKAFLKKIENFEAQGCFVDMPPNSRSLFCIFVLLKHEANTVVTAKAFIEQ